MDNTIDLQIPCKSQHLCCVEKDDKYFIYNKFSKSSCTIGENEWKVLNLCDGEQDCDQIYGKIQDIYSRKEFDVLIKLFASNNLLVQYESKCKRHILRTKVGLLYPIQNKEKYKIFYNIYFYFFILLFLPSLIYGISVSDFSMLFQDIKKSISYEGILCYYIISFASLVLHEASHAFAAKKYGGYAVEVGFMFYLFVPFFYVTIGGLSFVKKRYQRMLITFAGIIVNLFLVGIALIGYASDATGEFVMIWMALLITNMGQILLNLNCFIKVDLYYFLTQMLNEGNLYEKSIKAVKKLFREHKILKENSIFYIYGVMAVLNLIIVPVMLINMLFSIKEIFQFFC